jgi:hypothetical protein
VFAWFVAYAPQARGKRRLPLGFPVPSRPPEHGERGARDYIAQVIEAGSGRVFFAYVDGPDHAMIENNTARDDSFQHVHFLSDDPVSAGQWYLKHFGGTSGNPSHVARGAHALRPHAGV